MKDDEYLSAAERMKRAEALAGEARERALWRLFARNVCEACGAVCEPDPEARPHVMCGPCTVKLSPR